MSASRSDGEQCTAYSPTHTHTQALRGEGRALVLMHENKSKHRTLKMWTDVGKLMLLHLLLMELHAAKGKTLVSLQVRGGELSMHRGKRKHIGKRLDSLINSRLRNECRHANVDKPSLLTQSL